MSTGSVESTPNTFELPPPPQSGGEQVPDEQKREQGPSGRETYKQAPQAQPPVTDQPVAPPPASPPPATPTDDSSTQQPTAAATQHLSADESDLIEKEWVERAKHIVAATQDDPFKQKNEISKAKADYIQKRFNKTIKLDEAT